MWFCITNKYTHRSVVLRYSCQEQYVRYEQVNDEIFVDRVAVALHRPAVQHSVTAVTFALIRSATKTHIGYTTEIPPESDNSSSKK